MGDFRQFGCRIILNEDPALLLFKYQAKTDFTEMCCPADFCKGTNQSKSYSRLKISNLIFPASISLEQASSEETANFKSNGRYREKLIGSHRRIWSGIANVYLRQKGVA